jgi:hypothetical protein
MALMLREIDEQNRAAVLALKVAPEQAPIPSTSHRHLR